MRDRRRGPGQRTTRGVTLVDVLIAIAILGIGGAGMLALQVVVIRAHALARQMTDAVTLARQQMELLGLGLSTTGSDTVDAYGCSSARTCAQRGTIYTRTWTVGGGTPAQLQVRVQWQDHEGASRQVVLDGLR